MSVWCKDDEACRVQVIVLNGGFADPGTVYFSGLTRGNGDDSVLQLRIDLCLHHSFDGL